MHATLCVTQLHLEETEARRPSETVALRWKLIRAYQNMRGYSVQIFGNLVVANVEGSSCAVASIVIRLNNQSSLRMPETQMLLNLSAGILDLLYQAPYEESRSKGQERLRQTIILIENKVCPVSYMTVASNVVRFEKKFKEIYFKLNGKNVMLSKKWQFCLPSVMTVELDLSHSATSRCLTRIFRSLHTHTP